MTAGSSFLPQLIATLGATLGAFALGTVLGWPATALISINGDGEVNLSSAQEAQVVAIFSLGAAAVPPITAIAFPRIGKKWTLILLSLPFIAGWVVLVIAKSYVMLVIGRFLTGFSGGAFVVAAPAYVAEISEAKYRGTLSTLMQLNVTFGILFINVTCGMDAQLLSGICIVPPALLAIWMFFMPRTPAFLIAKGNMTEAKKSLQFLRGGKDAKVDNELDQIAEDVKQSQSIGNVSPLAIWTKPEYVKPMGISLVLMALQQLSGINFVIGFSTSIFEDAGSTMSICIQAILIGVIQVVGTGVTSVVVDKLGRKILLIISDLFVCISMVGVAVFFKLKEGCPDCEIPTTTTMSMDLLNSSLTGADVFVDKATVDSISWLPLVSLMCFILAFSVGLGPIPWIMNVEMLPPEARGTSAAICTTFNWLISYGVSYLVPIIGKAIHPSSCYFIFAAIAAVGTVFIIIVVPETKGKTEAEIRTLFVKNPPHMSSSTDLREGNKPSQPVKYKPSTTTDTKNSSEEGGQRLLGAIEPQKLVSYKRKPDSRSLTYL